MGQFLDAAGTDYILDYIKRARIIEWDNILNKPSWVDSDHVYWTDIVGAPDIITEARVLELIQAEIPQRIIVEPNGDNHGELVGVIRVCGSTYELYAPQVDTSWDTVVGNKTTLIGFGITDGINQLEFDGSGNAVTGGEIVADTTGGMHKLLLHRSTSFAETTHNHKWADVNPPEGLVTSVVTNGTGNVLQRVGFANGVLTFNYGNVQGGMTEVSWIDIKNKPTLIDGVTINGSGNVLANASLSGTKLTLTKGYAGINVVKTGSGNAITDISYSNGQLTVNKGSTFSIDTSKAVSWDSITDKPTLIQSVRIINSGNVVTGVKQSGTVLEVTLGQVQSGSGGGGDMYKNQQNVMGSSGSIVINGVSLERQNTSGILCINDTPNGGNSHIEMRPGGMTTFASSIQASTFYKSSDERLKTNIRPLEIADGIGSVELHSFIYKKSGEQSCGVIAQELEKVAPQMVKEDDNGMKSVDYIQFLIQRIASLEERVRQLECAQKN